MNASLRTRFPAWFAALGGPNVGFNKPVPVLRDRTYTCSSRGLRSLLQSALHGFRETNPMNDLTIGDIKESTNRYGQFVRQSQEGPGHDGMVFFCVTCSGVCF